MDGLSPVSGRERPASAFCVADLVRETDRERLRALVTVATVFGHDAEQWQTLRKSPDFYD